MARIHFKGIRKLPATCKIVLPLLGVVFVSCIFVCLPSIVYKLRTEQEALSHLAATKPNQYRNGNEFKQILLWTALWSKSPLWWFDSYGQAYFLKAHCPESRCFVTNARSQLETSDLVVFHLADLFGGIADMPKRPNKDQRWVFHTMEPPHHFSVGRCWYSGLVSYIDNKFDGMFNWTMSYHPDSDIYLPYGQHNLREIPQSNMKNFAETKTRQILWFVSNCDSQERQKYVKELQKYTKLDIYGKCGEEDPCLTQNAAANCSTDLKSKYKFYLSFENSRCESYITEKFWGALKDGMVPIVMGPTMEDYEKVAPPNSFIHVDNFTSPRNLAEYLNFLGDNNDAYNEYQRWTLIYSIELWPLRTALCNLCSLAHKDKPYKSYSISEWWNKDKMCWNVNKIR